MGVLIISFFGDMPPAKLDVSVYFRTITTHRNFMSVHQKVKTIEFSDSNGHAHALMEPNVLHETRRELLHYTYRIFCAFVIFPVFLFK